MVCANREVDRNLEARDRMPGSGGQSRGGQAVSNGRYYNMLQEGLLDLCGKLKQQGAS